MRTKSGIDLLNVLTPIVPGDEGALAKDLAELPQDLFAPVADVHIARWIELGRFDAEPARNVRPSRMEYLLFTAAFNGPVVSFLEQVRLEIGSGVDTIWRHCVNYPGHQKADGFRRYLMHNALPIPQRFVGYNATVPDVRAAITLREQHIAFATAAEARSDVELQEAFLAVSWADS
jgi:hypothetical protein